jgi:hypothetical protein
MAVQVGQCGDKDGAPGAVQGGPVHSVTIRWLVSGWNQLITI